MNKDERSLLLQNIPLTLLQGLKRVTQGFTVRGSWRLNKDCNILTPTLMAISVVSFPFSRAAQPEAQAHSAGCGLSLPHLITNGSPNSIGGPKGLFGRVWLSLPHLVSNSFDLQLLTSCLHRVIK